MENSIAVALEELTQSLEAIENSLKQIRQHQIQQDNRMDYFHNKLIAVHAAVDAKFAPSDFKSDTDYGFVNERSL